MNCNKKPDILYRILRSHFEILRTFLQSFFLANAAIYIRNLFCKDLQRSEILCRLQNRSSDRIKTLAVEHDSISYVQLALSKLSLFFAWYSFKPRVLLSLDNFVCAKRALFLWKQICAVCIDVRQPATNEMYLDSRSRLSNKRQCFESNGRKFVGKGNKMKHQCCLLFPSH